MSVQARRLTTTRRDKHRSLFPGKIPKTALPEIGDRVVKGIATFQTGRNSMSSETCPRCGTPLAADAPAGICPRCLVLAGFDSDGPADAASSGSPSRSGSGQSFEPPAAEEIAPWFPDLEVLEVIGHGGMGAVYKARQPKLDRIVALKIIRPDSAHAPTFAERFTREARTLARLNHPHVVALHDFGEVSSADAPDGQPVYYFLMEYVDGASLRELLQAGRIEPEQALSIVSQICDALQFAHDEGVVHRDIKPENILVDHRGRVRIADFGLARLLVSMPEDITLTATHQVMGTPLYMAPEQMTGSRSVDHRADLYSLGVILYEMLTGELPMGQFDPPSTRAGIDPRLDDIVRRSLAREPERRFQQASEIRSSVEQLSSAQAAVAPESPRPRGLSSIANREVMNVFRWVTADSDQSTHHRPEMPAMLLFLLCAAGCLTVVLPWFTMQVEQSTEVYGQAVILEEAMLKTLTGADHELGMVISVTFGICGLLVVMTPSDKRTAIWLPGLMILFAATTLTLTLVFRDLLNHYSVPDVASITDADFERETQRMQFASRARTARLGDMKHRVELGEGFYGSLGLSVTLLLLSAVGVRNAIIYRSASRRTQPVAPPSPRPLPESSAVGDAVASDLDLVAIRSELDGPSLALLVVGGLMFLINSVVAIHFLVDNAFVDSEMVSVMLAPGVLVGAIMIMAGLHLRKLKSRGWTLLGCLAGMLPINPGWFLTALASMWALQFINRDDINEAFVESARQREHR